MSYQDYYREMEGGGWALLNPSECPCKGYGWVLSSLDSWHLCRLHGHGVPHPEAEREGESDGDFDWQSHLLRAYRGAWDSFRTQAGLSEQAFRSRALAVAGNVPTSPAGWVDAAQIVLEQVLDERAQRAG